MVILINLNLHFGSGLIKIIEWMVTRKIRNIKTMNIQRT